MNHPNDTIEVLSGPHRFERWRCTITETEIETIDYTKHAPPPAGPVLVTMDRLREELKPIRDRLDFLDRWQLAVQRAADTSG